MKTESPNQYTGFQAPDFRFRFHVRAIAHRSLFLPLLMRDIPHIKRLLDGESPLSVFNCSDIHDARRAFCKLRKQFDFSYWAITEYFIRDRYDADRIIPLRFNSYQIYVIDIMQRRYYNREVGNYVVTKTLRPCGITTCIQAYITWLQTYQCTNNSYMCSSSEINLLPHKTNLCRLLKRDFVPSDPWLFLPKVDGHAFFNTFRSSNFVRGINLGYVHFADMSKWKDPAAIKSYNTYSAAYGCVLSAYFTLFVLEGNIPDEPYFRYSNYCNLDIPWESRILHLSRISNNPFFLSKVIHAANPVPGSRTFHIHVDDGVFPHRLRIPLISR